eukprot:scaffold73207_cov63-Phaeocystis_antarctica.AAC.2
MSSALTETPISFLIRWQSSGTWASVRPRSNREIDASNSRSSLLPVTSRHRSTRVRAADIAPIPDAQFRFGGL